MMNTGVGVGTAVLALSIAQIELSAQVDQQACQPGQSGVLNGSFDCGESLPAGDEDHGWFYNAPGSPGATGFIAEVLAPAVTGRSSNVLSLKHTEHDFQVVYPALGLKQEKISLGSQPAR